MAEYESAINTESLKKEIEEQLRIKQLTPEEYSLLQEIEKQRARLEKEEDKLSALHKKCPHPLAMRLVKNEGYSGGWDKTEAYWTSHKCEMCGKYWHTDQRWKYLGGKLGLPDDAAASSR